MKNIFEIPSPVPDVPHHPPRKIQIEFCALVGESILWPWYLIPGKSGVSISINKEFEMEEVPHPWVVEDEDALDQDHVGGVDSGELAR